MKKALVAIAIAVTAVTSGTAIAADWVESQPGDVLMGGEIISSTPKWLWKTGDGLSSFSNYIDEISGRVLKISVPNDELFLAGKMDRGLKGVFSGNAMVPKVEMRSYDGSVITPEFISLSRVDIHVKVKDTVDDTELGILTVPLTYGAASTTIYDNDNVNSAIAGIASGAPGTVFEGLINDGWSALPAKAIKWSGLTSSEMANHVEVLMPGKTVNQNSGLLHDWNSLDKKNYTYAGKASHLTYGAGIEANTDLVMKLNKDISGRTEWKAPVSIIVTYS
ncbi:TPA: F41 fimbrial protein [Escherichia coli]|uniref:F4 family fimbrial subunit n=1 Tax=Escherichia coli TaxID=562 RepID=UPI00132372F0|nr:F41 fimbrial protein [Escherichia coli]EHW5162612.1 F41 fimbrial protein [Escherichia coli]MXE64294.1 F41 fimbrial protein [Escherichia coli]HEI2375129.1 F41 fimbrial protein [Escherichia coli]HEI2378895.1 F41 fimbrial protein [Escherichia coli]HEI2401804.1 F41 fimbrial protein [Escherichia coli]